MRALDSISQIVVQGAGAMLFQFYAQGFNPHRDPFHAAVRQLLDEFRILHPGNGCFHNGRFFQRGQSVHKFRGVLFVQTECCVTKPYGFSPNLGNFIADCLNLSQCVFPRHIGAAKFALIGASQRNRDTGVLEPLLVIKIQERRRRVTEFPLLINDEHRLLAVGTDLSLADGAEERFPLLLTDTADKNIAERYGLCECLGAPEMGAAENNDFTRCAQLFSDTIGCVRCLCVDAEAHDIGSA